MKSTFFHVINPNSKKTSAVQRYLKSHGNLAHQWVKRDIHPTHLETLIEWAYNEGYRQLAIWGGDGSFGRAVQCVKEKGWLEQIKLALIPAGTCNDFARYLGLGDWRKTIDDLLTSSKKFVAHDIGVVRAGGHERVFINNAGFGRSSAGAQAKRSNPIKDIFDLIPKSLTIEWDSHTHHEFQTTTALLMIVFNAPYFNKGLHFFDDISAQDGQLNSVIVPDRSRWDLLFKFAKGRFGTALWDAQMVTFEAGSIHVVSKDPLHVQVDGDLAFASSQTDINFFIHSKKIQILSYR